MVEKNNFRHTKILCRRTSLKDVNRRVAKGQRIVRRRFYAEIESGNSAGALSM